MMVGNIDITEIESLAPMPGSVAALAKIQYQPGIWLKEVASIVENDPAITANLLRMANSAWSHTMSPIATVSDAVVRLGMTQVFNMALIMSLSAPLKQPCLGYELSENELARHSIASYLAAGSLGRFATQSIPEEAATAALLHDIGKLLLNRYVNHEVMVRIRLAVQEGKRSVTEAEQQYLGTDHAEVGSAIARHWKFPEPMQEAIRRHHDFNPPFTPILDAVQTAHAIAGRVSIPKDNDRRPAQPEVVQLRRLGLQSSDEALICVLVEEDLAKTAVLLGF